MAIHPYNCAYQSFENYQGQIAICPYTCAYQSFVNYQGRIAIRPYICAYQSLINHKGRIAIRPYNCAYQSFEKLFLIDHISKSVENVRRIQKNKRNPKKNDLKLAIKFLFSFYFDINTYDR